jgi:hypothetical protein
VNKLIEIISFCWFCVVLNGCNSDSKTLKRNIPDTIYSKNEIRINYIYNTDTLRETKILNLSTATITRSMLDSPEFRILKQSITKYDSLNFINCVNAEKYIPIRFFTTNGNILETSVYMPGQEGRFYFGKVSFSEAGDLIIGKGSYKILKGYRYGAGESRIKLQIFVPRNIRIKNVLFQCE